jgi:hypothetical protein
LHSIIDEGAGGDDWTGEDTFQAGLSQQVKHMRLDPWIGAPPEIWTESASLAGAIRRVTYRYRVRVTPFGGQASVGQLAAVAERISEHTPPTVWYLGDLDLSGAHIEASAVRRIEAFAGVDLNVERLAVTHEQVEEYELTTMQKYDGRHHRRFDAVEAEALGQDRMEAIVENALDEYWNDYSAWETLDELEAEDEALRDEYLDLLN